jgi:hypothetical protein
VSVASESDESLPSVVSRSVVRGVDDSAVSDALHVAAGLAHRLGVRLVVPTWTSRHPFRYAAAMPFGGASGRLAVVDEREASRHAAAELVEEVVEGAGLPDAERRAEAGVEREGVRPTLRARRAPVAPRAG